MKPAGPTLKKLMEADKQYHVGVYARLPVCFVKGRGTRLWDTAGREYLDFVAGLGVVNIGHTHPRLVQRLQQQLQELMHVSNLFYNSNQLELARDLSALFGGGRCFFANSGAEANEGAVKLARKYGRRPGFEQFEVITASRSFHGRTLAMVAATGQPEKQSPYEPLPGGFVHVPFNDLAALEGAVTEQTCAVMLEPVQGEGGVYPCSKDYLQGARKVCDQNGIALILDEVQTGIGRTGKIFAYEHFGVKPDIVTLAKGLGSGIALGAMVARGEIAHAFDPGDHGSTFGGSHVATAAGIETLKILRDEHLVENARVAGGYFRQALESLAVRNPVINEVRGLGLMIGVELKTEIAKEVVLACLDRGFVINGIGAKILRFLPPLSVTEAECDRAVGILEKVLEPYSGI